MEKKPIYKYIIDENTIAAASICETADAHHYAMKFVVDMVFEIFKMDAESFDIAITPKGKPFFLLYPEINFNISHSGKYTSAVVSRYPVGIDIQKIIPVSDKLAKRWLTPFELPGNTNKDYIKAWTKRESYGKMTGNGFLETDFNYPHKYTTYDIENEYVLTICTADK